MGEKPSNPQSHTGGVKPMMIGTRLVDERERLIGMTDEERAWRKKWLKDHILTENEPRHVPEYWQQRYNPIRRFYRWPLDQLQKAMTPMLGENRAALTRYTLGKIGLVTLGLYSFCYYLKYNSNDWTRVGGVRVLSAKPVILPNDPLYPMDVGRTKPSEYADRGFKNSPI